MKKTVIVAARYLTRCVVALAGVAVSVNVCSGAVTSYTSLASWEAAAGMPIVIEDFSDGALLPGFTISFGNNIPQGSVAGGVLNDTAVTQFNDANNPKLNFTSGTFVFGGDWDLSPGGGGDGLVLVLKLANGSSTSLFIGNPPGGAFTGFFGFISDVAVNSIRLDSPGTGVEAFSLDNARLRAGTSPNMLSFDNVADGTAINTLYAGLTFTNPIGGNIYARSSTAAPSPTNVVSVFGAGIPAFDARFGAVDVKLPAPVGVVQIDARPMAPLEFFGTLNRRPFLQAFDANYNLLGTVYYAGPLPTGSGEIGPKETLTFVSPANNIAIARWSVQNPLSPPGYTPVYGFFDNFRHGAPDLTLYKRGSEIVLSWPSDAGGWLLSSSQALGASANWLTWPHPLSTNLGLISASTMPSNSSRFFRLRTP